MQTTQRNRLTTEQCIELGKEIISKIDNDRRDTLKRQGVSTASVACSDASGLHLLPLAKNALALTNRVLELPELFVVVIVIVWSDILDEAIMIHAVEMSPKQHNLLVRQGKL